MERKTVNTAVKMQLKDSDVQLPFQSASVQLAALRAGEISSLELLELYLKRVSSHN